VNHAQVDTPEVARLLREHAQCTALRAANPYRAKAYSRAADSLAALAIPGEERRSQQVSFEDDR
jgi:DNA polymerase (family 10)